MKREKIDKVLGGGSALFTPTNPNALIREFLQGETEPWLIEPCWRQGEACFLFGDSGCGKSIYAVQKGFEIAERGFKVCYVDMEMSDAKFAKRYCCRETGERVQFPSTFTRFAFNAEKMEELSDAEYEDIVLEKLLQALLAGGYQVVILDNISMLCGEIEKGATARRLMRKLMLWRAHGLSLLILSHTPKRIFGTILSENDMVGSKMMFNLVDSCFCLGKSNHNEKGGRYLKQLKVRDDEPTFTRSGVLKLDIVKDGPQLMLKECGTAPEDDLLADNFQQAKVRAAKMKGEGFSTREIERETGVSRSTVSGLQPLFENNQN